MTGSYLISRIRRILDQVPFVDESVDRDSDLIGSPSTNFSDSNLMERIINAQKIILSRCKAQHALTAVIRYDENAGDLPDIESPIVRLMFSRVFRDNDNDVPVRATQRPVDGSRRLERSGLASSATYPTYTYEDGALKILPAATQFDVYMLSMPTFSTTVSEHQPLDERFENAIIMYVAASCYQTLQRPDLHEYTYSVFEDEVDAFAVYNRYKRLDDREVDVE